MIPDLTISAEQIALLGHGRHAVATPDAVFRIEGPGAVACLQGIVTNEVEKVVIPSLRYGAVLTPKGMIVTPLWIRRDVEGFWLVVPPEGHAPLQSLLARSFPPRLAKVTDRSDAVTAWRLFGHITEADVELDLAMPDEKAPFAAMAIGPSADMLETLAAKGWLAGEPTLARLAEVLGGWPALGHEIDEKTLPQEVGFDSLDGVKHDKGCYVGQETVARLHFRGHPNRTLRAVIGDGTPPGDAVLRSGEKSVGTIATLITVGNRWLATAKIRREVSTGDTVLLGGRELRVIDFPIDPMTLAG